LFCVSDIHDHPISERELREQVAEFLECNIPNEQLFSIVLKDPGVIFSLVQFFLETLDLTQAVQNRLAGLMTKIFQIRLPSTGLLDFAFTIATKHSYLCEDVANSQNPMHLDRLVHIYDMFYSSHMVDDSESSWEPKNNIIKHQ
jgi:hypothetical protein